MHILITGASGFIGKKLVSRLSGDHTVICLSRTAFEANAAFVQGAFDRPEDLRGLDDRAIELCIHLGAVTGGCSEEEGLDVNVLGTRRLYRYLLDRGCRRFVTASSIAAVGSLDDAFVPRSLPISDDHPCLATDAYGLSKAMVEELTRYFQRKEPEAEFVNLRFGAVASDDWAPSPVDLTAPMSVPFVVLAHVHAGDVVEGIVRVVEAPARAGARNYNLVGPDISSDIPAREALEALLGRTDGFDYYDEPGNAYKPLYAMDRFKADYGFAPARPTGFRTTGR
ncbi:NAD-dependent epimerase/dehydratase family protein [Paenibacillus glycinis]|uniref:NAD-dependent epimerase/dehydratase family protein n=1 Tax=Paenibacillus glycinis TaxID=2697035 RepID=A0ABW9XKR2_9BACL|nr:NAD(P)-dependent oxidoreductase [Paenibacillus glycinis]NBD23224.1 NAD-dependent epimerase/dehydratase family protein [Paenibacillus glycinis]